MATRTGTSATAIIVRWWGRASGVLTLVHRMICGWIVVAAAAIALAGLPALGQVANPPAPPAAAARSTPRTGPISAADEPALKPGDTFKECDVCPEMVVIPAGSFMMGSPRDEEGHFSHEEPQHGVTIARQFAIGRFAVTFDEWDACVADRGCNRYRPSDHDWGRGRRPVIDVSWVDAKVYIAWLSRKTGRTYRLPSEAEREYATRAGTATPFWWDGSISTSQANYDGDSTYGGGPKGEVRWRTLPVDSFSPNPWGLYQVHGNVGELVEDCYHDSYAGAPANGSAWTSGDCSHRVIRGGSWLSDAFELRSASRNYNLGRGFGVGFRVARSLAP
jgi:formylglycine-generating enzyme required for sulfatase activity